jgi:hypothetical protein
MRRRPLDQTISLRRPRLETQTPPFPPSNCRDLGLDLLIKIRPLSRQSEEEAGSELSSQTSSQARRRHGYKRLRGKKETKNYLRKMYSAVRHTLNSEYFTWRYPI